MILDKDIIFPNENPNFMKYNKIELADVRPDYASVEFTINENAHNPYGMLHGGVYFTMADCAAGAAARSDGNLYVTLNANINYLHGISEGRVLATATVIHRGKATCVVNVVIEDEKGRMAAESTITMFKIKKPPLSK